MTEKAFRQLNIDPEFKNLIRPLRREEYRQLELNLVVEGCREDIIAWNDTIIDGHNRYEICNKMRIPYGVKELDFPSRDAAIAWICANQLGRRNISEETRKYLIGKQYEAEKKVQRNRNGYNQYRPNPNITVGRGRQKMKRVAGEQQPGWEGSIMCPAQPYRNMRNTVQH